MVPPDSPLGEATLRLRRRRASPLPPAVPLRPRHGSEGRPAALPTPPEGRPCSRPRSEATRPQPGHRLGPEPPLRPQAPILWSGCRCSIAAAVPRTRRTSRTRPARGSLPRVDAPGGRRPTRRSDRGLANTARRSAGRASSEGGEGRHDRVPLTAASKNAPGPAREETVRSPRAWRTPARHPRPLGPLSCTDARDRAGKPGGLAPREGGERVPERVPRLVCPRAAPGALASRCAMC